ncbi:OLC1v1023008C1 [Oldenlandia corymbosa var. corymbosa]|uniref:OLC1v1023008C1 n=1 Tax=Oldenlandia corymbosa var. corymbosa TaxID=529605 RepID=A0AAV1C2P0_OLDCO|nr:OLC1v1023008C1 [Oldenlandia corymbosa var. corymbosa]
MNSLLSAYASGSDEEDDRQLEYGPRRPDFPPSKRQKPDYSDPNFRYIPPDRPVSATILPTEAPLPGRYVSKRERAALASANVVSDPNPTTQIPLPSPVMGTLSVSGWPSTILSKLRQQTRRAARLGHLPEGLSVTLSGHTNSVNTVQWSRIHAHLLASAGMDQTVNIWNVWSSKQKRARVLNFHKAAVKDVKWSEQGLSVLSCGYDCSSRLIDVERGIETQIFREDQVVGVVKFHPNNFNLFLSGGSKGLLKLWDVRTGKVVHEYTRNLGPILDVEFSIDGKQLVSSSDESRSNLSENSILVWDVSRQIPLSNQVYVEAYTCPCIRFHPVDPYFIAQSNGNYIAIFSSSYPFRLDKYKRYESHGVFGFPIKCNFSLDGDLIASGSSDGFIYFYDSKSSRLVKKIKASGQPCVDVAFHPVMPGVIATSSWNGEVFVLA